MIRSERVGGVGESCTRGPNGGKGGGWEREKWERGTGVWISSGWGNRHAEMASRGYREG